MAKKDQNMSEWLTFEHHAFDSREHYPAFTEHRMTGFQTAADKEAIGLSRVHKYYSNCNPPSQDICLFRS